MQRPVFAYWSIRGLAEGVRMFLSHLGVDYEDKHYQTGDAPTYEKPEWLADKEILGLPFPNLPYYIDEHVKLTETYAIYEYIANKHNPAYAGNTIVEKAHLSMLSGIVKDVKMAVNSACYSPDAATRIPMALDSHRASLTRLAAWLSNKRFLIGEQPVWLDFYFFELLDLIDNARPGFLAEISDEFEKYRINVRTLENVEAFVSRPRLKFNNKMAGWGG